MLRWPVVSGRAIAKLFRALQDVDVFVEDQGDEAFYTQLFSVAADERLRIARVVGLGGREPVLEAARTYTDARRALFLVDGDLPWVRGEAPPQLERVYQLNCYCIENAILVAKGAEALVAEEGMCSEGQACQSLQFDEWREGMRILVDLFIRFSVLNEIAPELATVGRGSLGKVLVDGELCPTKTTDAIAGAEAEIVARLGADQARVKIEAVRDRVSRLEDQLAAVSGKHFLLPLLFFRMRRVVGVAFRHDVMRFRLAKKCTRADLGELVAALSAAA